MASKDLVYRFFGVDAGASAQFDRMAGKLAAGGAAWAKYATGATAVVYAIYEGVKSASQFQSAMTRLHTQANVSTHDVGVLSKGILAMAASVASTPTSLAQAAYHIASVGQKSLTTAQELNVLRIAAEGAKIGGSNLVDTTNALDAAIVSGIKGVQNYGQAMGVLNATVGAGDMTMQDLADALSTGVVTAAKTAGLSITDVGAALAVFGDNNIRGATAAQRLTRVIMLMQAPSSAAAKALASIGITQTELAADMRKPNGLSAALTDLQQHLKASGLSAVQQSQVIAEAFGRSRGAANVELLLAELDRLDNKYKVLDQGANGFAAAWKSYTQTFSYQFDRMRSEVEVIAIKIGQLLLPAATALIRVLADIGVVVVPVLTVLGSTIKDVAGFFEHNTVAAMALATVLGGALVPKLVAMGVAFATVIAENVAAWLGSLIVVALETATAFTAAGGGVDGFAAALAVLNLNPVIAAIGAATIVVTGLALWLSRAHDNYDSVSAAGQQWVDALHDQHTSAVQSTADVEKLVETYRRMQQDGLANTDQAKAMAAAIAEQGAVASKERTNVAALAQQYHLSATAANELATRTGLVGGSYSDLSSAAAALLSPTQKLHGAEVDLKGAVQGSDAAVQALSVTLDGLVGNTVSADQQQNAFASGLRQLKKDLDASHGSLSRLTTAGTTARDDFDSLIQTILGSASANEKLKDGGDKARTALQGQITMLKSLGSNSPYVIGEIRKLTQALNSIPTGGAGENAGADYIRGILKGLNDPSLRAQVYAAAASDAALIDSAARGPHGINAGSPSKKAIQVGLWYAQGLAIGVGQGARIVYLSAVQVAHQLAVGLTEGWHNEALKVKDTFSEGIQTILTNLNTKIAAGLAKQQTILKNHTSTLKSDLQSRNQAIASLQSSVAGNAGISNVITTDANGNPFLGNVGSYLSGQASLLKREAGMFAQLRKMGLAPALLAQISAMAPSDAIEIMSQILTGQDGSIGSLNTLQASIGSYAKQIATGTVNTPQQLAVLRDDRRDIREQTRLLREIADHMQHFRDHPASTHQLTLVLREEGFTDHEIRKLIAAFRRAEHRIGAKPVHR